MRHTEQRDILQKEAAKVRILSSWPTNRSMRPCQAFQALEQEEMNHRESLLASRPESVV